MTRACSAASLLPSRSRLLACGLAWTSLLAIGAWGQPHTGSTAPPVAAPTAAEMAGAVGAEGARLEVQAQVQVEETHLLVTVEAKLTGDQGRALDLDRSPLQLPFPAPVIDGVVLDRGTMPSTSQGVDTDAVAPLSIEKANGGFLVRGKLRGGQVGTVRARVMVAFKAAQLRLGIAGVGAATWASFVVMMAPPTRARLSVDRPSRISTYEQGNDRMIGASLAQNLKAGEVAVFELNDLPAQAQAPRRLLSGMAVAMATLFAWLLSRRRAPDPSVGSGPPEQT